MPAPAQRTNDHITRQLRSEEATSLQNMHLGTKYSLSARSHRISDLPPDSDLLQRQSDQEMLQDNKATKYILELITCFAQKLNEGMVTFQVADSDEEIRLAASRPRLNNYPSEENITSILLSRADVVQL